MGLGILIVEVSTSHSGTPHSLELFSATDRPDAVTSTPQHPQKTDIRAPGGVRTHNPSKGAAADPRLRPRGHISKVRLLN
jgi:hypothetical protein